MRPSRHRESTTYQQKSELTVEDGPKVFIQSTKDEHGPRPELESLYKAFADPKEIHWVDSTDHFFVNGLDGLEEVVYQLKL